jgi:ribokinase
VDYGARLTVLGSLNMDISVTVAALPGPGATVLGGAAAFAPGGKGANQAVAAARLGAASGIGVRMVGCVGDDDFGRALRAALVAEGVDDASVRTVPGVPSGIAMITVDRSGENMITVAPGANREVGAPEVAATGEGAGEGASGNAAGEAALGGNAAGGNAVAESAATLTESAGRATESAAAAAESAGRAGRKAAHVLVISAEVPVPAIAAALGACAGREPRPLTVLNLAPAPPEAASLVAARPDWLVVNESEAAAVLGRPVSGLAAAAGAAADLVAAGAANAVVTAGAAGAAYHGGNEGQGRTVAAFPVRAVDTVGAGDTFVGALAVALAAGIPPEEAVTAAAAAAATAATRPGTQTGMPRPADVRAATAYEWPLLVTGNPQKRLDYPIGLTAGKFKVNMIIHLWEICG